MTIYRSNQGSEQIEAVLADLDIPDLNAASASMWAEVHNHPGSASCACPAVELLCSFYERGYRLVRLP